MAASGLRRRAGVALWVAACVAGGCAVERVTAVDLIESGAEDGAIAGGGDASIDGTGYETSSSSSGGESGVPKLECTDASAAYTTSAAEGQFDYGGGRFIRNDVWNIEAGAGPQTLSACSYSSFNVVANEPNTTVVKSYPDVQMDFQPSGAANGTGVPLDSFKSITSTFAEVGPDAGLYEYAYDIFVNSGDGQGATQILIWVDVHGNRMPAANEVETEVSLGQPNDVSYDVYETDNGDGGNGGHYVVFVANRYFSSGPMDVLAFLTYASGKGWIPPDAVLNQICFGVEICETNGADATFEFTDFSITTN